MNVSIIMPAYNTERFLAQAVASVIGQTHQAWELVIVDDGSTDGTGQLAERLAAEDARIRCLSQPNRGQGAARNRGVAQSSHPWLAFLDADDLWHAETLERLCRGAGDNEVAFGTAVEFSRTPPVELPPIGPSRKLVGGAGLIQLIRHNIVPLSCTLVRRRGLEAVGGFDPQASLRNVEDYHLWLRLLASGAALEHVPDAWVFHRRHEGNVSGDRVAMKRRRAEALSSVALPLGLPRLWRAAKAAELRVAAWRHEAWGRAGAQAAG